MSSPSLRRALLVGLVRLALLLYPPGFRRRFGATAMLATFRERLDAEERAGRAGVGLLLRTLLDVVRSAAGVWMERTPARSHPPDREASSMDIVRQDLHFAFRSLLRRPGFAAVAVLTLALGIGANTAMFSVVNGVLLRPLPYPEPEGLVRVWAYDTDEPEGRGSMSRPDLEDVGTLGSIESITGFSSTTVTLTGGDRPEVIPAGRVTGDLFRTFDVAPALGRDLTPDEARHDGPRRVVIGHDLWMERWGGSPDVVGRTLEISERSYEIVGVAPPGFDFPSGARVWIGDRNGGSPGCGRGCHTMGAVARMAPGAELPAVNGEMATLAARLSAAYPDSNHEKGLRAESLTEYVVGDVRAGLWIVLGAVAFVLLIACANVANLLLARATSRRGEMAVRAALGAGRRRLVAQVLVESLVLAGAGALLGLVLAGAAISGLRGLAAGTVPRIEEIAIDPVVLAFTASVALVVALLFGLGPALSLGRAPMADGLVGSGRTGSGRREGRSRGALLALEVGLSLVLLVGAALMLRSLQQLHDVDLGFETREVVRFRLALPDARYEDLAGVSSFYRELESRLAAIPGVVAVGSGFGSPLGSGRGIGEVIVDGRTPSAPGEELYSAIQPVTPGYLDALRIPVLRGRRIEAADREGTPPVALVNETFVRSVFPGEDPIGKRVHVTVGFGYGDWEGENEPMWEIVGVVGDVRTDGPRAEVRAELYVPQAQYGPEFMDVHMRGAEGASGLLAAARQVVGEMDPNVPLRDPTTLEEELQAETAVTRFYLALLGLFAVLAVLLAAVGLYGVVSYLVSRRTREVGIRMALGARGGEIVRMVVSEGLRPAGWGVAAGLVVALIGGGLMESVLFGVEPADPLVLVGVTVLLLAVVVAASMIPALRATRVDPSHALRID